MLRRFAALLLALLPLGAQTMPGIRIRGEDPSRPARLQELRIDVKVVGHVATTTWDFTLHNPQDRVLEGELDFPLGEGQTVTRFALDMDGRLREGVVVDRAKGRKAFEETVRRNVDPGLLEKTAGNSFRARVYPIPARGTRRLVLAYEQELPDAGADLLYQLPLAFKESVALFSLRVEVLDQPEAPRAASSPLANFAFRTVRRGFVAEETRRDFAPATPLSVVIPRGEGSGQVFTERRNGQDYFCVMVHPRLPREPRPLPRHLLLAWDASASARARDLKRELDLLEAYLGRAGTCEVTLAVFRDRAEPLRTFSDPRALRAHLEALPLDGATALALDLRQVKADATLLFSDGLATFGGGEARFPAAPLVAITSAPAADHALLRALAEGLGGEAINLQSTGNAEALADLLTRPLSFLRATFSEGQVQDVLPASPRVVRGPFTLAGRLLGPGAKVTLHFGFGTEERLARTLVIDRAQAAVDAPVARLWAQKKLAELELDRAGNAGAIHALGQAHGLVTEGTSLIVLDSLADYLQYGIQPPDELRVAYEAALDRERTRARDGAQEHLEALVAQFQERRAWWNKAFKPGPPPKPGSVSVPPQAVPAMNATEDRTAARQEMQSMAYARTGVTHMAKKSASAEAPEGLPAEPAATLTLAPWSPDTPYLRELKAAPGPERYALYLRLREAHGTTPGFFLDVADLFREMGEKDLALRILSNLAELRLADAPLLRVLGHRLRQLGYHQLAVWTFEEVLRLREEDPQSRRDLALACADAGQRQRALDLLWEVARTPWDNRFRDVGLIALGELNALAAAPGPALDISRVDPRLRENLPVDIRVVLNWDTDNSDMDLHVVDPRGETCFYGNTLTALGGRISADVTQGYGPEEFLLKKAVPGTYKVKANFFGTREQTAIGATTVVLELYLRYGTGRVENKSITLRLTGAQRLVDVGSFLFQGN